MVFRGAARSIVDATRTRPSARRLPIRGHASKFTAMKAFLSLFAILVLAAIPAQAQCKDCGCKEKCSPTCQCKHDEKPKAQ